MKGIIKPCLMTQTRYKTYLYTQVFYTLINVTRIADPQVNISHWFFTF